MLVTSAAAVTSAYGWSQQAQVSRPVTAGHGCQGRLQEGTFPPRATIASSTAGAAGEGRLQAPARRGRLRRSRPAQEGGRSPPLSTMIL